MDLARDLLDVQLIDPRQRPIGRVDGILLEVRPGQPPPRNLAAGYDPFIGRSSWTRQGLQGVDYGGSEVRH